MIEKRNNSEQTDLVKKIFSNRKLFSGTSLFTVLSLLLFLFPAGVHGNAAAEELEFKVRAGDRAVYNITTMLVNGEPYETTVTSELLANGTRVDLTYRTGTIVELEIIKLKQDGNVVYDKTVDGLKLRRYDNPGGDSGSFRKTANATYYKGQISYWKENGFNVYIDLQDGNEVYGWKKDFLDQENNFQYTIVNNYTIDEVNKTITHLNIQANDSTTGYASSPAAVPNCILTIDKWNYSHGWLLYHYRRIENRSKVGEIREFERVLVELELASRVTSGFQLVIVMPGVAVFILYRKKTKHITRKNE